MFWLKNKKVIFLLRTIMSVRVGEKKRPEDHSSASGGLQSDDKQ